MKTLQNFILGLATWLILLYLGNYLINQYQSSRVEKVDSTETFIATIYSAASGECEKDYAYYDALPECYIIEIKDPKTEDLIKVEVLKTAISSQSGKNFKPGREVQVSKFPDEAGNPAYLFNGFDRINSYFTLIMIFVGVVVLVTGKTGLRSVVSLFVSVAIIGYVIIPLILRGYNPILVATSVGFVMLALLILISHGANRISYLSIAGSGCGILVSIIFAYLFSVMASISGLGDENTSFLILNSGAKINAYNLVVASFIMGCLGVIDDATVSQVHIVEELLRNKPSIKLQELYHSAMRVGVSHVGSLTNTLFLAYVASTLPLITLLFVYHSDVYQVLNLDVFAEEIVRTAVGSIGLITAIPATTLIAAKYLTTHRREKKVNHET